MGAQLVSQAFAFAARWESTRKRDLDSCTDPGLRKALAAAKLKPNEVMLLVFIAHTAKDTDAEPRYWGAWERSAFGLGRVVPDEPDDDDPAAAEKRAERSSAAEVVRRAVQGLVQVGVLRSVRSGGRGRTAEYALTFPNLLDADLLPQRIVGANSPGPAHPSPNDQLGLETNDLLGLSPNDQLAIAPTDRWGRGEQRNHRGTREEDQHPDPASTHVFEVELAAVKAS